jgi:hypothetical protein
MARRTGLLPFLFGRAGTAEPDDSELRSLRDLVDYQSGRLTDCSEQIRELKGRIETNEREETIRFRRSYGVSVVSVFVTAITLLTVLPTVLALRFEKQQRNIELAMTLGEFWRNHIDPETRYRVGRFAAALRNLDSEAAFKRRVVYDAAGTTQPLNEYVKQRLCAILADPDALSVYPECHKGKAVSAWPKQSLILPGSGAKLTEKALRVEVGQLVHAYADALFEENIPLDNYGSSSRAWRASRYRTALIDYLNTMEAVAVSRVHVKAQGNSEAQRIIDGAYGGALFDSTGLLMPFILAHRARPGQEERLVKAWEPLLSYHEEETRRRNEKRLSNP